MTLIEKSRNYNLEEIVKQETIKAFYDKLYETFNSRPYLYDICKDLIDNGLNDYRDFDIYSVNGHHHEVSFIKNSERYIAYCYERINVTSKVYNNAFIHFCYKHRVEIASQPYNLNISVALQFDRGKPVFSAFCINEIDAPLLTSEQNHKPLNYEFSNQVFIDTNYAKIQGSINDDDFGEVLNLDVNITPDEFVKNIRKAIIS